jgi:hypothetical protein
MKSCLKLPQNRKPIAIFENSPKIAPHGYQGGGPAPIELIKGSNEAYFVFEILASKCVFLGVVVRPLPPPPLAPLGDGGTGSPLKVHLVEYYKSAKFDVDISNRLGDIDVRKFRLRPSMTSLNGTDLETSHCVLAGNGRSETVGKCIFRFLDPDFI